MYVCGCVFCYLILMYTIISEFKWARGVQGVFYENEIGMQPRGWLAAASLIRAAAAEAAAVAAYRNKLLKIWYLII